MADTHICLALGGVPVSLRTTGHGIAAGVGKLGAFIGVFLVPVLDKSIGLRGMLLVAAGSAGLGYLVTLLLPEAAGRTRQNISATALAEGRPGQTALLTLVLPTESGDLVTVEPEPTVGRRPSQEYEVQS